MRKLRGCDAPEPMMKKMTLMALFSVPISVLGNGLHTIRRVVRALKALKADTITRILNLIAVGQIFPSELLTDVIKRLEASESTLPARKNVVACAAVCRSWREMCKEIVDSTESLGKITFPIALKQPGPRDTTIQCFIKRDTSNLSYYLYLCLGSVSFYLNSS
ncbi:tubby-like F-box protein 1 [Helianthus annuus]|uniref:tubby-like F-box protein 1 n=1 Tax=Helianthus annuus TaxID=4232 RepID=UPI000B900C1F|nr:tubby-like F-box protein 1 [Helianthus annuus]